LVEIGLVVSEENKTMMSFLTYITGLFMNFELLPIFTDYANKKKGGMKLKKISSPLKLEIGSVVSEEKIFF
jgi:hypothetical protein